MAIAVKTVVVAEESQVFHRKWVSIYIHSLSVFNIMKLYKQLEFLGILPDKNTLVVDCGCGDGRVLIDFYNNGYNVFGIDKDEDKIKEVKNLMLNGNFVCGDIRNVDLPTGFIIFRNVLQFLDSKDEVNNIITKNLNSSMYISLFGKEDELKNKALTWTRDEVEKLMQDIGKITRFTETKGKGKNLKNEDRFSHTYEILRMI